MRHYLLLLFIGFSLCLTSCREDFEFEHSTGSLEFSKDTVYLDTVFTNIGSSTYTLKVYNRSNKDIKIPSIRLGEGEASKYRLMVDGTPGKVFNDVELLAKDSMFVFIETTIDYSEYANNTTTFLYNDKILFDTGANEQKVDLVTLVQDAIFIKPDRSLPDNIKEKFVPTGGDGTIEGHTLTTADELHWTNEKPYVVYGYAHVPDGQTLTIDAGVRVHFHAESGILVDSAGRLLVNGTLSATEDQENEVIFEGDRLEPEFSDVPGQWSGLYLLSSADNKIEHLTLKNAVVGIFMDVLIENTQPKLTINNSQIYNCGNFGILGRHAILTGDNLVANNAGQAPIALTQGGTANFRQCTFANYFNSFNQVPVLINDYADVAVRNEQGDIVTERRISPVVANFDNCILYGSSNVGVSLEYKFPEDVTFKTTFNHCHIKMVDFSNQLTDRPLYPFAGNDPNLALYTGCVIATSSTKDTPDFLDPQNNKLMIGSKEAGNTNGQGPDGTADPVVAQAVGNDILGVARNTSAPDIGAYESTTFPEE